MIKIMTNIKQLIMTLVALFAISTGAWAAGKVYTSAVDITALQVGDILTEGASITGSGSIIFDNNRVKVNGTLQTDGFCYLYTNDFDSFGAEGVISLKNNTTMSPVDKDNNDGNAWEVTQVSFAENNNRINIQGITYAPAGIEVNGPTIVEGKPQWTFAMPAGNVELQVEYYPGMLVKPTNLVGGTLEIVGLTDTTLPEGFEKDDEGNIYVAKGTKFTVKAVPDEGFHLVSWSDDATITDLEREITMGDDDFELTATFSDKYTVTLNAEGLSDEEAANWKAATGDNEPAAFPLENVSAGTEVKVTYTGTKKVLGVKAEKKAKAATLADALVDGATVVIAFSYGYLSTNTFTNNNGTFTLTDATGFGAADDETTQLTADGSNLIFKANWDTSIDKNWSNLGFQVTIDTTDNTYVVWKSDTAQGYSAKFTSITVNGTEIQLSELK